MSPKVPAEFELRDDETLVAVLRQHPVTLVPELSLAALLIFGSAFLLFPLFSYGPVGMAVDAALFALGGYLAFRKIFLWLYTFFVVTDTRIVDVARRGFFDRHVSEFLFGKIQDVSYRVRGLWQMTFRCGHIYIQSYSGTATLKLRNVANPAEVQRLISRLVQEQAQSASPGFVDMKTSLTSRLEELPEKELRAILRTLEAERPRAQATRPDSVGVNPDGLGKIFEKKKLPSEKDEESV